MAITTYKTFRNGETIQLQAGESVSRTQLEHWHLWWANHQKVDAKRIAKEQDLSKMRDLAEQAMKKLTEEELNALLNYVRPK